MDVLYNISSSCTNLSCYGCTVSLTSSTNLSCHGCTLVQTPSTNLSCHGCTVFLLLAVIIKLVPVSAQDFPAARQLEKLLSQSIQVNLEGQTNHMRPMTAYVHEDHQWGNQGLLNTGETRFSAVWSPRLCKSAITAQNDEFKGSFHSSYSCLLTSKLSQETQCLTFDTFRYVRYVHLLQHESCTRKMELAL